MKAQECIRFESCSAPICPLSEYSGIWYADEEYCRSTSHCSEGWLQSQKKIARRTRDFDTYYTRTMLQRNYIIGKGIAGINPDHDINDMENDEASWLNEHPEKLKLSDSKREDLRNRMLEIRRRLYPPEKGTNGLENLNSKR